MNKQIKLLITLMGCALSISAQESAHVHGKGKMLISQEKNNWHIQLILPAVDVLGFEHNPNTQKQREIVGEVAEKFRHNISIVKLDGKCLLGDIKNSLREQRDINHHEDDVEQDIDPHGDIEVEYFFSCQSSVTKVSLTLFKWIKSLTSIEVQWVIDNGQGMTLVTREEPTIEW
jgi:hypothetical protein